MCACVCLYVRGVTLAVDQFLPHPAGGKAASRVGPKIVLDHVRVYIKTMFVRFGFPHYWLYTMLLTTHLRRGLTRTEK